ncbi:MAG TPA: Hsp20/alpha crystallin family protein [Acidobacteriota bacterium]|nr:Hsp20/alpha crystallin family protein [Acidobacteriota bacterium]
MTKKEDIDIIDTGNWGSMWDSVLDSHDPYVDVYRKGTDIVINVQLPDIEREDIQLRFINEGLEISAQNSIEAQKIEDDIFHYRTFSRAFYRLIPLPTNVDENAAQAQFRDGVLTIRVPHDVDELNTDYMEVR